MAAPSGTKWGSIVGNYGKIGLYVTTTNATASVSVKVQVWLATKYSASAWGHLYFNDNTTSASTLISNMVDIETYHNTGSGWDASNQILLYETNYTVNKTSSAQTRYCAAKLGNVAIVGGTMTVYTSYSVGANSTPSGLSTTIKPTASKERNTAAGSSWANYSYDSDCASYDGGNTTRIGGTSSSNNYNAWYEFPTGNSFLNSAQYEITSASFKIFQPYFASPNAYSGTGTVRFRIGKASISGTAGLSSTAQTLTAAAKTVDGTWYEFSNATAGAKALQAGTANGVYCDVSDWSSTKWYSRLTYHGGSSYYPRFTVSYKKKSYTLSVPSVSNASVSGGGTFVWGTTVSVSCTPKLGYHFNKWTLSGGSTSTSTKASWSFTMPTANTTATASVAANTYTVSYNANGGSGTTASSSHTYGTAKALTANGFSRTGYTFTGWNTQANGSGQSYSNSQRVTNLTSTHGGTITLYAQWRINSYTLTVNPNGGTFNSTTSNSTFTQNYNTTKSIAVPTRTGYIFGGWFKTPNGSLSGSNNQDPNFTNSTSDVGVYNNAGNGVVTHSRQADTSAGYSYTIAIKTTANTSNPGYGGFYNYIGSAANKTYIHTFRAKVPVGYSLWHASNAVGDNSAFTWLTDNVGTGQWENYAYRLTTGSTGTFSSFGYVYMVASGSLPVTWYLGGTQITTAPTSAQTFTYGAGNTTLTAVWIPERYTIQYDANGGTGVPDNQIKTYDVNLILSSITPTRASVTANQRTVTFNANGGTTTKTSDTVTNTTSYSFKNWNTNSGGTGTSYAAGATYSANAAATLYAQWNSNTTANTVTLPTETECARSGYKLLGFSTSASATSAQYLPGGSYAPTADVTLYAVWGASGTLRLGSETYTPYVYYNGAWVTATTYAYVNGKWVEGI